MAKRTDRGLENREIVLDILMEVLERGSFVHVVLNQALDKYQYLDKADRAFITRLTEGTLEYLIQIDAIINQYSKTKTQKMKPVIRNLLRLSIYQILHMDRVPDSALPFATSVNFCSHSAVSMGEVSGSGRTVTRLIPSFVGIRFLPFRSTNPAATSFSMMAALVAGVPKPFRSASSGISALPAFSMADRRVSSV